MQHWHVVGGESVKMGQVIIIILSVIGVIGLLITIGTFMVKNKESLKGEVHTLI